MLKAYSQRWVYKNCNVFVLEYYGGEESTFHVSCQNNSAKHAEYAFSSKFLQRKYNNEKWYLCFILHQSFTFHIIYIWVTSCYHSFNVNVLHYINRFSHAKLSEYYWDKTTGIDLSV